MVAINSFIFPTWTNSIKYWLLGVILFAPPYIFTCILFGFSPVATDVGYAPEQPVPYSHALHAGDLGMDCRYCHYSVEKTGAAPIPSTATCMNCHSAIWSTSAKLEPVRDSYGVGEAAKAGMPVEWQKVHDLPDYAYFNHSAHATRGIGCVTCHGRIDKMEVVYQFAPLSMNWCLDCHREPEKYLRPIEELTNMTWRPSEDQLTLGRRLKAEYNINPPTDCTACHR